MDIQALDQSLHGALHGQGGNAKEQGCIQQKAIHGIDENKMIIHDFLNKRYSLRELSDEEFNRLVPILAQELSSEVDYVTSYTDAELLTDRRKLVEWKTTAAVAKGTFASTNRIGMKLCEHFFPNFYDIETPSGKSFASQWRDPVIMEKVLHWNRKSHSTPYLSELKRGVYFCGGLPKSTMYRPQMSKMVVHHYCNEQGQFVLDPCAGWGGRLLGTIANQCHYIGFEPNSATFNNLQRMVDFLGIQKFVTLINDDALNMGKYDFPSCNVVLTSPPYFNLEVYSKEKTQSVTGRNSYDSLTYTHLQ